MEGEFDEEDRSDDTCLVGSVKHLDIILTAVGNPEGIYPEPLRRITTI